MEEQAPTPPRVKRPANVSRSALASTLDSKLSSATLKLYDLRLGDSEHHPASINSSDDVQSMLSDCRATFLTAKTFGDGHYPPRDVAHWLQDWERKLDSAERDLWDRMTDERDAYHHGEGPSLIGHWVPTPSMGQPQPSYIALGVDTRDLPPPSKGGVRFAAYPDTPVSQICALYLELSYRFVRDFKHAFPP
jgi:hypothetical protein